MKSPVTALFVIMTTLLFPLYGNAQTVSEESATSATRLVHTVIEKTNIERINHGLAPLKFHEDLAQAAIAHGQDMVKFGYFAHSTPNAPQGVEDYEQYARQAHYPGRAGQNLYHGEPNASLMVTTWMNSPDHRSNILEPKYNEIGIGVVRGREYYDSFGVQFFGIHKDSYPVIINNEAYSTANPTVHLYIYGQTKMKQMRFSNDGVTFTRWESFQSERDWTLPAQPGRQTVFIELTDGKQIYRSSDTILLIATDAI